MIKKDKFGKMCKEKMVDEISSLFKKHPNFIVTSYMGSSVADLEQVRKSLNTASGQYIVVKNSLLRVILDKQKMNEMKSLVDGGIGVSFSGDDIVATCKILANFSKTHESFKIKGAVVDGKPLSSEQVKVLASLPSREVLLSMAFAGMKSPITGFVNTLAGVLRKFVYCLDAIKNSKQKTGEVAPKTAAA